MKFAQGTAKRAEYDRTTRQVTWAKLALAPGGTLVDEMKFSAISNVEQGPVTLVYTLTTTAPVLKQASIKTNTITIGRPQAAQRADDKGGDVRVHERVKLSFAPKSLAKLRVNTCRRVTRRFASCAATTART